MAEMKNICGKIPVELHEKVRAEIEEKETSTQIFIQQVIEEHFNRLEGKGEESMEKRTLAVQVTEELFQRVKWVVAKEGIKQKDFIIRIIEKAVEEVEAKWQGLEQPEETPEADRMEESTEETAEEEITGEEIEEMETAEEEPDDESFEASTELDEEETDPELPEDAEEEEEELTLREITAPEGYEIAEDVKFTLEDTMEIQKVEMKDARTPETPGVPQTGDDHWKPILLFVLLGASAAGLMATMIYKKKHGKTEKADETKKEE